MNREQRKFTKWAQGKHKNMKEKTHKNGTIKYTNAKQKN